MKGRKTELVVNLDTELGQQCAECPSDADIVLDLTRAVIPDPVLRHLCNFHYVEALSGILSSAMTEPKNQKLFIMANANSTPGDCHDCPTRVERQMGFRAWVLDPPTDSWLTMLCDGCAQERFKNMEKEGRSF